MKTFELGICDPFSTIICHKIIPRVAHGCPNIVPESLLLSNIVPLWIGLHIFIDHIYRYILCIQRLSYQTRIMVLKYLCKHCKVYR